MDGHSGQNDQGDGDDRMHDKHEPMPGSRVRAFGLALDQNAIFVFLANDFGHFSLMVSIPSDGLAIPGIQKANPGGLAKCKKCNKIFWLPDLGSNQGPTD